MQATIPHYRHRIRKGAGGTLYIFDAIRKKWVRLLPEEWVRQQFIRWLIEEHRCLDCRRTKYRQMARRRGRV